MTWTTHSYIPVEMVDDPAVLNTVAYGQPYQVAKDLLDPDSPWAFMRVEWPSEEAMLEATKPGVPDGS
jgi:hypothetical protein